MKQMRFKSKCKISKVEVTEDTLTDRGGLALYEYDCVRQGDTRPSDTR